MPRANPRTSSATTPLLLRAARIAPAMGGGHWALVRHVSSSSACDSARSRRSSRISSISRMAAGGEVRAQAASQAQEVLQQARALRRQDAFRMKLHTLQDELAMAHAHDLPLQRACADFQLARQGLKLGDQRVITPHLARLGQSCKHGALIVMNDRSLAVFAGL